MSTIREIMQAEADDLRARAVAIEKKIENVEPELQAILEHDAQKVVAFFRSVGEHIFAHKAPTPATASAAPVASTGEVAAQ